MNTSLALRTTVPALPAPAADSSGSYRSLVVRLSRASVKKHFDAYADIPWDDPDFRIEPEDPRWVRTTADPLGATDHYRSLPEAVQARIGLAISAFQMKMGIAFESVLQRGLLELAATLPNRSEEFRYAYHEVIEEGQHSLMFQEFVNRSGFDPPGMGPLIAWQARKVPALGRTFPELFFIHVLAGEAPIDSFQRKELRRGDAIHPLQRRIMQIHVTEEARHVCFAERYLEEHLPKTGALRLLQLRTFTPFVLRETAALMLRPPAALFDAEKLGVTIPKAVLREAYQGPTFRKLVTDGLAPVRDLSVRLGIVTPASAGLWRALGIWETEPARKALTSG